jgi:hypothetical protein
MIAEGFSGDEVDAALISGDRVEHAPWHQQAPSAGSQLRNPDG